MAELFQPAGPRTIDQLINLTQQQLDPTTELNLSTVVQDIAEVTEQPETELPERVVLSDEDIIGSQRLKKLGAMPGDEVVNGELIRTQSTAPRGEILTLTDILESPRLQELNAEAGDFVENGKLVKSGENDPIRNFLYSYEEAQSPVQNLSTYLESRFPLGNVAFDFEDGFQYISPEDYSDDFLQLPPEERRQFLVEDRLNKLEAARETFEPTGSLAGTIAGSLDPSILFPVGRTLAQATAIGGALGGGYTAADQLAQQGQISIPEIAGGAALGAGFGAGANLLGAALSKAIPTRSPMVQAERTLTNAENIIARETIIGTPQARILDIVKDELNLTQKQLAEVTFASGRKLRIPGSPERAQRILDNQIAVDSAVSRQLSPAIDKVLGALSTRIKNISVPVFARARKYEADLHINTAQKLKSVEEFQTVVQKAPASIRNNLKRQLLNGNYNAARALIRSYAPNSVNSLDAVTNTLKSTYDDLVAEGHEGLPKIQNYFPRKVKDLDGLLGSLGKSKKSEVTRALEAVARSKNKSIDRLTIEEESDVVDKILRGYKMVYSNDKLVVIAPSTRKSGGGFSGTKKRTVQEISDDQLKYYASPEESLQMYLRGAVNDIERRKFFGQAKLNDTTGGLDLESSIGRYVAAARNRGAVDDDAITELSEMLSSRFIGGEQSAGGAVQFLRDTGYMGTIANPISAITQIGDLATSGALYGVRNTLASMFGPKQIKIIDLGLQQTIAEEMTNPSLTGRILNQLFRVSGFKRVDQLGKESTINAALRKYQTMAQSSKGRAELQRQWGEVFGDETEGLIADLQARVVSPNVKVLAFHTISDVQPVSRLEMPQFYNENPSGRLLYMLKSFTLKQYDIARREIVQEYQKGNKKKAIRNAAMLFGYLTAANTGTQVAKDILLGREFSPDQIPERSLWALLGVYGANQYMSERYLERGDIKGALVNLITPATPLIDAGVDLGKDLKDILDGSADPEAAKTYLRSIPVIGPILYAWFGGGAEAYNERQE